MPKTVMILLVLALAATLAACGKEDPATQNNPTNPPPNQAQNLAPTYTHDELADDAIEIIQQYLKVLASVKDEPSAQDAKPKIGSLAKQLQALADKRDNLPRLNESAQAAFMKRYIKHLGPFEDQYSDENARLKDLPPVVTETIKPQAAAFKDALLAFNFQGLRPSKLGQDKLKSLEQDRKSP